jgi:uncharacterized protein (TIGR02646 family)
MRFIEKNFDAPPPGLKECAAKYGHGHNILTLDKSVRAECCRTIRPDLEKLYNGKCAYCESRSESEIEHYRPYKLYWWLYFEWTNLLPACPTCNKKKGARFPLKDKNKRITGPGADNSLLASKALMVEEPLLLNPELDDPRAHLVYLPQTNGKIEVTLQGTTDKGKTTIDVLDLNRAWLKVNYKRQVVKIVNDIEKKTKRIFHLCIEKNKAQIEEKKVQLEEKDLDYLHLLYRETFQELKELQVPYNPGNIYAYTQLGYQMYEEFDLFIFPHLPENIRNLVSDAFNLFKEGKPADNDFDIPGIKEFKDFQIVIPGGKNNG